MTELWKGLPGIHDLSKIQCGILETLNGIRDLTKIQYGIRETLNGIRDLTKIQYGILETLNGIRDLTKIQYGIRETLNGIRIQPKYSAELATLMGWGIWLLPWKRDSQKIWAEGSRIGKENDIRDSNKGRSRRGIPVRTERAETDAGSGSPFPDPTWTRR